VPDKTIDELLEAIETVQILKDTLGKHEQLITRIADRLDAIEERLRRLESPEPEPRP
jgi:uncharacterized coiled-coil protein SlyX